MPTLLAEQITGRALSGFLSLIAATLLGLVAVQYGTDLSIADHRLSSAAFFVPPYFARPVVQLNDPAVLRTDEFGNALANLTVIVSAKENITDKFGSQPAITVVISDGDVAEVYNHRTANISIHQKGQTLDPAHQEPVETGYQSEETEAGEETLGILFPLPPSLVVLWHRTLDIAKTVIRGLLTFLCAFGPDWVPVAREIWCIISKKRSSQGTQPKELFNVILEENISAVRDLKKIQARISELQKLVEERDIAHQKRRQRDANELRNATKKYIERASKLRKVADTEAKEKKAALAELERAQAKLATLEEQQEGTTTKLNAQISRGEAERAEHQRQYQALVAINQARVEGLKTSQDSQAKRAKTAEEDFERTRADLTGQLTAALEQLEAQSEKAEADKHALREELEEAHTQLNQADIIRADVFEKTQDLVQDLQSQIEDHVERSHRKSDELADKEGRIAELEWDNKSLEKEMSCQTKDKERLLEQLEELQQSLQEAKKDKAAFKEAIQRAEQAKKEAMAVNATTIKRQDELITEQRKVIEANRLSLPPSGVRNSLTTGVKRGPPQPPHLAPRPSLPPPNAPTGPRAERRTEPPSSSSSLPPPSALPYPAEASPAPPALTRPTSSGAATFPVPEGGPIDIPWFTFPARDSQRGRGRGSDPRGR